MSNAMIKRVLAGAVSALALAATPAIASNYLMKLKVPGLCATCGTTDEPVALKPLPPDATATWAPPAANSNLLISNTNLVFDATAVGEDSAEKAVHFTVRSSRPSRILGVRQVDGEENFRVRTDCPSSGIVAGTYCSVFVRLSPTELGSVSGSFEVATDDVVNPVAVQSSGDSFNREPGIAHTGGGPKLGSVRTDRPLEREFWFTNTGDGILQVAEAAFEGSDAGYFTVVENGCESVSWLPNRNKCAIKARFAPTEERNYSAILSLKTNVVDDGGDFVLPLDGSGAHAYAAVGSAAKLSLGTGAPGTLLQRTFYLQNTSDPALDVPLNITELKLASGEPFSIISNSCSQVAPGGSCALTLGLTSPNAGPWYDSLVVTANTRNGSTVIPVEGTLLDPTATTPTADVRFDSSGGSGYVVAGGGGSSGGGGGGGGGGTSSSGSPGWGGGWWTGDNTGDPTSPVVWGRGAVDDPIVLGFGYVDVGKVSSTMSFRIVNTSAASITGLSLSLGSHFTLSHNCPSTLPSMGSCDVAITAAPTAVGEIERELVASGVGASTLPKVRARVIGQRRILNAAGSLGFGNVSKGVWSGWKTVTVSSSSSSTRELYPHFAFQDVSANARFEVSRGSCGWLSPNESCAVSVRVMPLDDKAFTGKLITTGGMDPQTTTLSGTGSSIVLEWEAGEISLGSVPAGTSGSPVSVRLHNRGEAAVYLNGVYRTYVTPGTSSLVLNTFQLHSDGCSSRTLAAGGSCEMAFKFVPGYLNQSKADGIPLSAHLGVSVSGLSTAVSFEANAKVLPSVLVLDSESVLEFPDTYTGATSPIKKVRVRNAGEGHATIYTTWNGQISSNSKISIGSEFFYGNNGVGECRYGVTLAPGATCEYPVWFQSAASGTNGTYPKSISVSGTSAVTAQATHGWPVANVTNIDPVTVKVKLLAGRFEVTPPSLEFPDTPEGLSASKDVVIQAHDGAVYLNGFSTGSNFNASGAAVDGIQACRTMTLAPGEKCNLRVTYSPSITQAGVGETSLDMTVHSYQGNVVVPLTATSVQGALTITPELHFPDVPTLTSTPYQLVLVRNEGPGRVTLWNRSTLNSRKATGEPYNPFGWTSDTTQVERNGAVNCFTSSGTSYPRTLEPGQVCYYRVLFSATEDPATELEGAFYFDSSLTAPNGNSSTSAGAHSVRLTGTVLQPEMVVEPETLTFPDVPDNTVVDQVITVKNTGLGRMRLWNLPGLSKWYEFPDSQMSMVDSTCGNQGSYLEPNTSCQFKLRFAPTGAARDIAGDVRLYSKAQDGTERRIPVTGNVLAPEVTVSPASFEFGDQLTHGVYERTVTLTNSGSAALNFTRMPGLYDNSYGYLTQATNGSWRPHFGTISQAVRHDCPSSLAPGQSCSVTLRWSPVHNVSLNSSINVRYASNAGGNLNTTRVINMNGKSYGSELTAVSDPFVILTESDSRLPGDTPAFKVQVKATGPAPVALSPADSTSPGTGLLKYSAADSDCPAFLMPGESCELGFKVNPLGWLTAYQNNSTGVTDFPVGAVSGCGRGHPDATCADKGLRIRGTVDITRPPTLSYSGGRIDLQNENVLTVSVPSTARIREGATARLGTMLPTKTEYLSATSMRLTFAPDETRLTGDALHLFMKNPGPWELETGGGAVLIGRTLASKSAEVSTVTSLAGWAPLEGRNNLVRDSEGNFYFMNGSALYMVSPTGQHLASYYVGGGTFAQGAFSTLASQVAVLGPGDVVVGSVRTANTSRYQCRTSIYNGSCTSSYAYYYTTYGYVQLTRLKRDGAGFNVYTPVSRTLWSRSGYDIQTYSFTGDVFIASSGSTVFLASGDTHSNQAMIHAYNFATNGWLGSAAMAGNRQLRGDMGWTALNSTETGLVFWRNRGDTGRHYVGMAASSGGGVTQFSLGEIAIGGPTAYGITGSDAGDLYALNGAAVLRAPALAGGGFGPWAVYAGNVSLKGYIDGPLDSAKFGTIGSGSGSSTSGPLADTEGMYVADGYNKVIRYIKFK